MITVHSIQITSYDHSTVHCTQITSYDHGTVHCTQITSYDHSTQYIVHRSRVMIKVHRRQGGVDDLLFGVVDKRLLLPRMLKNAHKNC